MPEREETRKYLEDHLVAAGTLPKKRSSVGALAYGVKSSNSYAMRHIATEKTLLRELGEWRQMLTASHALDDEQAREFSSTMSEVLMNSFVHGKTAAPCIVAGQTFTKAERTMLVAADAGRSIPATLESSKLYPGNRTDAEWVAMALQRGVTCKTMDSNMGYGLFVLTEKVKANGGMMILISRNGIVTIRDGGEPVAEPIGARYPAFAGTLLILELVTAAA